MHGIALALFGIGVPIYLGLGFLDVLLLMAYACLPWVFVTPLVAESTAGLAFEPEQPGAPPLSQQLVAKLLAASIYATCYGVLILTLGLSVVNMASHAPRLLLPSTTVLVWIVLVAAAGAFAFAALTVRIALRAKDVDEAKRNSRRLALLFIVLALAPARFAPRGVDRVLAYFNSREIHLVAIPLVVILLVIGGVALWFSLRALRPEEPVRLGL